MKKIFLVQTIFLFNLFASTSALAIQSPKNDSKEFQVIDEDNNFYKKNPNTTNNSKALQPLYENKSPNSNQKNQEYLIPKNKEFLVIDSEDSLLKNNLKKVNKNKKTTPNPTPSIFNYQTPDPNKNLINSKFSQDFKIFLDASIDNASGNSYENVYSNDAKQSELKWKFNDIKMAKTSLTFHFNEIFSLNINYASSLNNSYNNSTMTDYDWRGDVGGSNGNANHNNWTDYSFSKVKTNLKEFDINSSSQIVESVYFKFGYREMRFNFEDKSQNYIYSCTSADLSSGYCAQRGLRNRTGNFNSKNGINYFQRFRIPYVGAVIKNNFFDKKLNIELYGAYSSAVFADDQDHHVFRSLVIKRTFQNGEYYNLGANLKYAIYKNLSLKLGYDFSEIPEIRGDSSYEYYDNTNPSFTTSDSAGISNKTQKISLGLSYFFDFN